MLIRYFSILIYISGIIFSNRCNAQLGPDPWNYEANDLENKIKYDANVPPDLRITPKRKVQTDNTIGIGEWFFKRLLGIVLKGGQVKKNEDGSVDISLQMKLKETQWETLDNYLQAPETLSEEKFRRSLGFIEQAIYEPSITDKIVMAWSDYIQIYLTEYKTEITWTFGLLGVSGALICLWGHMSHRHLVIIIILTIYLYEVFISYKEAEKQELDRFLSAVNHCKWYFWSSSCDVPKPDIIIFLKHMNPLKIAIRMFTTILSEPIITLSDTLKTIVHGITDGLWFPLDKIVYSILIFTFNVLLLFFLIMIVFNYILNIPFSFSFMGLINIGLRQRNRTIFSDTHNTNRQQEPRIENTDRISGATLERLLDVCSRALTTAENNRSSTINPSLTNSTNTIGIRRSASAGRLTELAKSNNNIPVLRITTKKSILDGSGDAR